MNNPNTTQIATQVRILTWCTVAVLLLAVAGSDGAWFPWANLLAIAAFGAIVLAAERRFNG